jgi:hypothetical protein
VLEQEIDLAIQMAATPLFRSTVRSGHGSPRLWVRSCQVRRAGRAAAPSGPVAGLPLAGRGLFLPGQDTSAYLPPVALLEPRGQDPRPRRAFGPVDTVVLVDSPAELLAGMNASTAAWSPPSPTTTSSWPASSRRA